VTQGDSVDDLRAELALQRAVIDQLEEERRRLEDLVLEMPKLFGAASVDELVVTVAEAAASFVGADFALFVPADGDAPPTLVGRSSDEFADLPSPGVAPLLTVGRESGARSIPDVTRWATTEGTTRLYGTLRDGRLVRSWIVAPVRGPEEELIGVLYLGHPRPHVFTGRHEAYMTLLGSRLGAAIDAAHLVEERERVVRALESSLLPPLLPKVPGLDIAARYHAADDVMRVGGDFYDVYRSGDARWSVVIGDVCGAGPEAAAVTGIARYSLRAITPELSPAAAVERLNATLTAQRPDGRFVTAVVAEVVAGPDTDLAVVFANAGHPPPVVQRDAGSAVVVDEPHGALIGVVPQVRARNVPVDLGPGDALVLYTDGVVEARDAAGRLYGTRRLVELVASCAGRRAASIARRIEHDVLGHAAAIADDMAILVLRRDPTVLRP
jgi:serine phosphatase RsbU (regulator of sigma subunit)